MGTMIFMLKSQRRTFRWPNNLRARLYTSVGKLPVHYEIWNKNACGNFASLFSIIKNAIFFPPWCNICGGPPFC